MLPGVAVFSEVMAAGGGAPAFLSSSSLSDPPEELLSEAMTGAFLPSPAGRAPEEALASAGTQTKKRVAVKVYFVAFWKSTLTKTALGL